MSAEFEHISVLQKLNYHSSDVTTCHFGSELYLATGSGDKTVCVWEWKPGLGFVDTTYSPLLGHKYTVTSVRFSPQGSLLASASIDGSTNLWNVKTGENIATFVHTGGNGVRACCFSNSNNLATAGDDGTICLWDLVSRALVRSVEGHEDTIECICFTPDSTCLVTGDVGGQLKLWNINSFSTCLSVTNDAHDLGISGLDISSAYQHTTKGKCQDRVYTLLTCGMDHMVRLWTVHVSENEALDKTGKLECCAQLAGHSSAVTSVCFDSTGRLAASTSLDKTARLWDITSRKCLKVLEEHSRFVACCAFSRDQTLLATGSNDKTVCIWTLDREVTLDTYLVTPNMLTNSKGKEETVMKHAELDGNHVKLWQRLENTSNSFNTCHFLGNHLLAAGGSGKNVFLWRRRNDRFVDADLSPLEGHRYTINHLEFSSDGKTLVTCSLDGTALIWDVQTGSIVKNGFQVSGGGMRTARFSPDARLLATGGDDENVSVYRTDTCESIITLTDHTESVSCVAFTSDSYYLVSCCSAGNCRVWCAVPLSNICLALLENAHDLGVASCDFANVNHRVPHDGEKRYLLATCGNDSLVKMWQIQVLDELTAKVMLSCKLSGHGGNVTCVRFSPGQSEVLASTATDKTCRIWDAYTGECVHVLDQHDSILTCCAFSTDASFLATGSLDKSVLIWELPKDLAFQNFIASRAQTTSKESNLKPDSIGGVLQLFSEENLPPPDLNGITLNEASPYEILNQYQIDDELREKMSTKLGMFLRKDKMLALTTPEEFTCPITHQVMREPVTCVDGYNYERCAIESWFASGRETSPMTNTPVESTVLVPNQKLQQAITDFLKH